MALPLLVWAGALTLGAADVLSAGLVPGPATRLADVALALAALAAVLFVAALAGAVAEWRARRAQRRLAGMIAYPAPADVDAALADDVFTDDAIRREAEEGVARLESWLAGQEQGHGQ